MSCTIIDPATVSLNGGSTAYGGVISKVSLTFGLLSSATMASVTLIQDGSTALSTPTRGDDFTLGIMGMDLNFRIKGYSMSDSAGGATQLTINLSDKSHVFLDQNFIALKEEWPNWISMPNVDVIGTKMGTLSGNILVDAGFVVPNSDTIWGDLRAHFKWIQNYLKFYPWGLQINDEDVDYHVNQTSGKTIWGTNEDPIDDTAKTLKDIIADVIEGDLPDGTFDFSGSYREVLMQIANTLGKVAYWDAVKNKAVIEASIDSSAGMAKLSTISSSCEVISSSESSDFSTAMSVGAVGNFASNYPGESQETQGGKMSRYYSAKLLDPTFYYTPCKDTGQAGKMLEMDLTSADTLKAMSASHNDKVYAMYVLQTVLSEQGDAWDAVDTEPTAVLQGRQNQIQSVTTSWKDKTVADPVPAAEFETNALLASFYKGSPDLGYTCVGNLYPMMFVEGSNIQKAADALSKGTTGWNQTQDTVPCSVGGDWNGAGFDAGVMFFRPANSLMSILSDSGFDSGTDVFQKYLEAISSFYRRYYVVTETEGNRSVYDANGTNYGFYISGENSTSAMNWKNDGGYRPCPVNPYICVADCGIDEIKNLFLALSAMCNTGNTCVQKEMQGVSIVDFLSVLKRNKIKDFFSNPAAFKLSPKTQSAQDAENDKEPTFQMHLLVAPAEADYKSVFAASKITCWDITEGINSSEVSPRAVQIAEQVTVLDLKKGEKEKKTINILNSLDEARIWLISRNSIGPHIKAITLPDSVPKSLKSWYLVEGSTGTLKSGPGQFFISGAKVPAKSDDIWSGTINFGVSVNAADVGQTNEVFAKWAASTANEGSPYSFSNQTLMSSALGAKIAASTWVDTAAASSRSVTVILGEDSSALTLPSVSEGLESLSISTSGGRLEITMTVGNSFERQAKKAMFKLSSSNTHPQHVTSTQVPDTFSSTASPRFVQLSQGLG